MWRLYSSEKIEGRRSRGWQRIRWLIDISDSVDMCLRKVQEIGKDSEAWCAHSSWGCRESDMTTQLKNSITSHHSEWLSPKNWCFQFVVLKKTLESPLDSKEIKSVDPKENQPWIFIEGLILKLQYFGHLMQRLNSLGKTLMLGNIENQCPWLRAGGEVGDWRWDGWMASLIQWIWANFRR